MIHRYFSCTTRTTTNSAVSEWPFIGKISFPDKCARHLYGFIILGTHQITSVNKIFTIYLFSVGLGLPIMRRGFFLIGYFMGDFLLYDFRASSFFYWYFRRWSVNYARFCSSVASTDTTPRHSRQTLNRQRISLTLHSLMTRDNNGKFYLELIKYFWKELRSKNRDKCSTAWR